jgi:DNA-binding MarR family transcriptional regulator
MDEFPIVAPPSLVSAPLIEYLARRLRSEMELEVETFGLRTRHMIALTLLREFGERGQSELAEALWVDPTNLVGLLNELEAADLIERRRSPQDRRRHTVALTPAGSRRLAEIEVVLARVEHRVLAALDSGEQATLYTLLHRAAAATAEFTERPPIPNAGAGDDCVPVPAPTAQR